MGISSNPLARLGQHKSQSWFDQIVRIEIERCPSRSHALHAESVAICDENPRHNIKRNTVHLHPDAYGPIKPKAKRVSSPTHRVGSGKTYNGSDELIKAVSEEMRDRKITKIWRKTGISQPTLARLRDGIGPFREYTLLTIAEYLGIHGNTTQAQP